MAATASNVSSLSQSVESSPNSSTERLPESRNHALIRAESKAIKAYKPRGGRRPGAGRKPNWEKALRPNIKPITAAVILAEHNELKLWEGLLTHADARIRLDAAKYLTDRRDGKAKQAIEHLGPDGGPLQAAVLVKFVESDK